MAQKVKKKWFQGLVSGMDQVTDPSLVENNESPLLNNVTLDQPGNWNSRKGTLLLGDTTLTSERVWGLMSLVHTDGIRVLFQVTAEDLYSFDESGATWGSADDTLLPLV